VNQKRSESLIGGGRGRLSKTKRKNLAVRVLWGGFSAGGLFALGSKERKDDASGKGKDEKEASHWRDHLELDLDFAGPWDSKGGVKRQEDSKGKNCRKSPGPVVVNWKGEVGKREKGKW